jgi:hypothetical protein
MKRFVFATSLSIVCALVAVAQFGDQFQPQVTVTSVVFVAAVDSSAKAKASTFYVCDGINDEVTIQAAIASLPATSTTVYTTLNNADRSTTSSGGEVVLCAGTYTLSNPIDQATKLALVLRGEGASTVLNNTQTDGGNAIEAIVANPATTAHPWRCEVRDMMIQGNAQSGWGIYWYNGDCQRIHNVHFVHNGLGGAYIGANLDQGMNNKIISDCQFLRNYGYGLSLYNIHETLVSNCHIEENATCGLYANGVLDLSLSNCSIEDNMDAGATYGLHLANGCRYATINGCTIEDDVLCDVYGKIRINSGDYGNITVTSSTTPVVIIGAISANALAFPNNTTLTIANTSAVSVAVTGGSAYFVGDSFNLTSTGATVRCAGSAITMSNSTFSEFSMSGGRLSMVGNITVSSHCAISSVTLVMNAARSILASAASAQIDISGIISDDNYVFTIDGNGQSTVRCAMTGCNFRLAQVAFEDIAVSEISGNLFYGTGTLTFTNCDTLLTVVGNTIASGCNVTIGDTCAATQNWQMNTVSASNITQAGTGTIVNANNVVVSGTGWNP